MENIVRNHIFWSPLSGSKKQRRGRSCPGFNFLILRHSSVKTYKSWECHLMKRQRPLPLQALISSLLHVLPSFYHTVPLQSQERDKRNIYFMSAAEKSHLEWLRIDRQTCERVCDWVTELGGNKVKQMEGKAAVCSDFSPASHWGPSGGAQQFETNLCTSLGGAGEDGLYARRLPNVFIVSRILLQRPSGEN